MSQMCEIYETFGDCNLGQDCRSSHKLGRFDIYRCYSIIGTIIPDSTEEPELLFLHVPDSESPRKFYIPNEPWFHKNSKIGDRVEIQVSERYNKQKGSKYARILKVISPPTSQCGSASKACERFDTFNDCFRGDECRCTHTSNQGSESYFGVGTICSVASNHDKGAVLSVRNDGEGRKYENIYVPFNDFWHMKNAKQGDFVIYQISPKWHQRSNCPFGKVMAVVGETNEKIHSDLLPLHSKIQNGFIVDSTIAKQTSCAFSNEPCSSHGPRCRLFGIHIGAAGLSMSNKTLSEYFTPLYRKKLRKFETEGYYFKADTISMAISVYIHTESDIVTGPLLTAVYVDRSKRYSSHKNGVEIKEFRSVWLKFEKEFLTQDIASTCLSNSIFDHPQTWRVTYVCKRLKKTWCNHITRYMHSNRKCALLVSSCTMKPSSYDEKEEVSVLTRYLHQLENAWTANECKKTVETATFIGLVNRAMEIYYDSNARSKYYSQDVIITDAKRHITEEKIVRAFYPSKRTSDFLNQQMILAVMLGMKLPAYTKEDLFGIVVRRCGTPKLLKATVKHLTRTAVRLQFQEWQHKWRENYREVELHHIFRGKVVSEVEKASADSNEGNDDLSSVKVLLGGIFCEEYHDSSITKISGELFSKLTKNVLENGLSSRITAEVVSQICKTKKDEIALFSSHKDGTLVHLQQGIELILQVSDEGNDAEFLRLIELGKGCHICLLHINHPWMAFMCDREDIRRLNITNIIRKMKTAITENTLRTKTINNVCIEWRSRYFYGGKFSTDEKLTVGTLLCIRKEIFKNQTKGGLAFIWICHAIVSKVLCNSVEFLVCSLYQDQAKEMWNKDDPPIDFIVEIIKLD